MGAPLQWTPECSVGVEEMDLQHKRWFEIVNEVESELARGPDPRALERALEEALDYTRYHFRAEEKLMEQMGYPELAVHRQQHRDFVRLLQQFSGPTATHIPGPALGKLLRKWLRGHILAADRSYAFYASETGRADS